MISLGSDITLGKGERTIKRHLKYANFSDVKIHMILLSPIKTNIYKKKITRKNRIFIYPLACNNHFLLLLKGITKSISLCKKIKFNLIYSQDPFGTALIANIIRKIFKIPLLIGNHSSFVSNKDWLNERPIYFRFLSFLMYLNLPLADAWRVNNKKEKEKYINYHGIQANRIVVNNTLVDTKTFTKKFDTNLINDFKSNITQDSSTKLLLWVGRPVKFKKIDLLINTFSEVQKTNPNTKLVLVGNFKNSILLNKLLENTDSVLKKKIYIYSKGADHDLLSKFYRVSDIYLHTSVYEGYGVVLSEAALSGLPIVSTSSDGSIENIEDGKSGFLVKPHTAAEMAKYVNLLLNNETLRKEMSKYTIRRAIKKYDEINNLKVRDRLWKKVAYGGINCSDSLID